MVQTVSVAMSTLKRIQNGLLGRLRRGASPVINRLEKPLYAHKILSTKKCRLPDFICIGAMKAGTTWLYENMRCHPEIYVPDRKEDYFFSYEFYKRSLRQYSLRFSHGDSCVKGEITPGYGILEVDRIRFIRSVMPDVKLILLLRDPIYRAWSEACMNLAIKKQRKIEEVSRQEFLDYFNSGPFQQRSDYVTILDNWLSVFPRQRLFLGLYEDIETSAQELLRGILTHLGVSVEIDMSSFPLNAVILPKYEDYGGVHRGSPDQDHIRSDVSLPDEYREFLVKRFGKQVEPLNERFGLPVERWSCGTRDERRVKSAYFDR